MIGTCYGFFLNHGLCSILSSKDYPVTFKAGLYRIWCGVHRLGDSGVHTLGDTSAFVNPAGQLLLIAISSGLIANLMASA